MKSNNSILPWGMDSIWTRIDSVKNRIESIQGMIESIHWRISSRKSTESVQRIIGLNNKWIDSLTESIQGMIESVQLHLLRWVHADSIVYSVLRKFRVFSHNKMFRNNLLCMHILIMSYFNQGFEYSYHRTIINMKRKL